MKLMTHGDLRYQNVFSNEKRMTIDGHIEIKNKKTVSQWIDKNGLRFAVPMLGRMGRGEMDMEARDINVFNACVLVDSVHCERKLFKQCID